MSMMFGGFFAGSSFLSVFFTGLIAFFVGTILAFFLTFTLTKVVAPSTHQSDTSLIVYGQTG